MPTNFANFEYYGKTLLPDDAEPVFKNVNNLRTVLILLECFLFFKYIRNFDS